MDTDNDPVDYGGTPWYIYECVPFIKDIKGYDENSGSQNKLLENFIKQMNTKPLDMVDEFLTKDKVATSDDTCNGSGSKEKPNKGYLKQCRRNNNNQMCCSDPWNDSCPESDCFSDFSPCDGKYYIWKNKTTQKSFML